ncbi:uncharacterized protein LOC34617647 [Cyclospora cayetanensis]|uniref:Uncharacterized protein LOC34617647 n=1 Tax=Cyclospora cayetanensis TaxID=88456 RepID=A0A6P6RXK2_9EIME|nr:uncharacterized protein LOC34617647 [Cyclospora cayetanensis]
MATTTPGGSTAEAMASHPTIPSGIDVAHSPTEGPHPPLASCTGITPAHDTSARRLSNASHEDCVEEGGGGESANGERKGSPRFPPESLEHENASTAPSLKAQDAQTRRHSCSMGSYFLDISSVPAHDPLQRLLQQACCFCFLLLLGDASPAWANAPVPPPIRITTATSTTTTSGSSWTAKEYHLGRIAAAGDPLLQFYCSVFKGWVRRQFIERKLSVSNRGKCSKPDTSTTSSTKGEEVSDSDRHNEGAAAAKSQNTSETEKDAEQQDEEQQQASSTDAHEDSPSSPRRSTPANRLQQVLQRFISMHAAAAAKKAYGAAAADASLKAFLNRFAPSGGATPFQLGPQTKKPQLHGCAQSAPTQDLPLWKNIVAEIQQRDALEEEWGAPWALRGAAAKETLPTITREMSLLLQTHKGPCTHTGTQKDGAPLGGLRALGDVSELEERALAFSSGVPAAAPCLFAAVLRVACPRAAAAANGAPQSRCSQIYLRFSTRRESRRDNARGPTKRIKEGVLRARTRAGAL